jgi:hypothetical protein
MGFLRVLLLLFLLLLAVSLVLRVWLRLRERGRLADEWENTDMMSSRASFVREGMARYDRSLLPKLLWGVVVVPMAGLALLLYLLNVS